MNLRNSFYKNWDFVKIKNTHQLMKPCFLLYRLYGVHPFTIRKKHLIFSQLGLCHSILLAVISVIYLFIVLYQSNVSRDILFDTAEGKMQFNCYFILASFITVCACIYCGKRLFLTNQILDVSTVLPEDELISLALIIYFLNAVGYSFLMAQGLNIYLETKTEVLISKLFALYMTFIVFLIDFQYSSFVLILRSCFKNINNSLLKLKDNFNYKETQMNKALDYQVQIINLFLLKLRKLQQKHHEVCIVVKQLNSTFTLHIIATVLMTFAEVTFGLYFFFLHIQGKKNIDLDKQIWYNFFLTSVIYHSIKMATVVWTCKVAKSESLKTGIIVHDIILNTSNSQLKSELCLFSLQLLQCNIHFTSQCIIVDGKLITSVVSGITTYLLILMQFLKTKNIEPQ